MAQKNIFSKPYVKKTKRNIQLKDQIIEIG